MQERKPEGHPIVVMAAGGILGGLVVGGNNGGTWTFFLVTIAAAYLALVLLGHISKNDNGSGLGMVVGLSTVIPLPCGFVGMMLGKHWWGV
jgi:hypothetical protein